MLFRSVLLIGLASIAAMGVGTVTLGLRGTTTVEAPPELTLFSVEQYSVLCAIADTLHTGANGLPTGTMAGVPLALDHVVGTMNPADRDEFLQALTLIENALVGALLDQRTTTFTGSSPEVRAETLRAWQNSRVYVRRQAFKALKGLCAGVYWSQPEMGRLAGYLGPMDYGQASSEKPTTFAQHAVAEPSEPLEVQP